jgi:hypothetical protein
MRPDQYLPDELQFSVKCTQYIAVQHLSSGLHEYYCVTFDADNYVVMDLMVHCCISAVHFHNIIFYPEIKCNFNRKYKSIKSSASHKDKNRLNETEVENANSGPLRKTRVTTTVDTSNDTTMVTNAKSKGLGLFSIGKYFTAPEKLLFGSERLSASSGSTVRSKNPPKDSSPHDTDQSLLKVTVNPITMASAIRKRILTSTSNHENRDQSTEHHETTIPKEAEEDTPPINSFNIEADEDDDCITQTSETADDAPQITSLPQVPSIPTREKISEVYDQYTAAIIRNYFETVEAIHALLEIVSHPEQIEKNSSAQLQDVFHEEDEAKDNLEHNEISATGTKSNFVCSLVTRREEYIDALVNTAVNYGGASQNVSSLIGNSKNAEHVSSSASSLRNGRSKMAINQSLTLVLQQFIDSCQEELALQWSLFTATLRRNLFPVRHHLILHFFREQSIFWKQQMISHTREYDESHSIASTKDSEMWQILADHIAIEKEHEREVLLAAAVVLPTLSEGSGHQLHYLEKSNDRQFARGHYARGLRIFDWRILRLPSRLPYLLLEQYSAMAASPPVPLKNSFLLSSGRENPSEEALPHDGDFCTSAKFRGTPGFLKRKKQEVFHVIFLHHGFLGGPYDMRLLAHALQLLLIPTDTPQSVPEAYVPWHHHHDSGSSNSGVLARQYPYNNHRTQRRRSKSHLEDKSHAKFKHSVLIHCCTANEGTPSSLGGIREMGQRMADEVISVLREKAPAVLETLDDNLSPKPPTQQELNDHFAIPTRDHRVSFIGHSLGGLIIRSALQEEQLQPLRSRLHTFMSLASPHVGNLYSDSSLVSTGMWALAKFKNYRCLQELVLEDGPKDASAPPSPQESEDVLRQQSLLFRLSLPLVPMNGGTPALGKQPHKHIPSHKNALCLFKHVICVSSPKDQYVSTYSARIQVSPKVENESQRGTIPAMLVCRMIENLTANVLNPSQLVRVMVVNNEEDVTVNGGISGPSSNSHGNGGNAAGMGGGPPGNSGGASSTTLVTDAVSAPTLINSLMAHDLTSSSSSAGMGTTTPSGAMTLVFGGVTDINSAIGRSAHICYLDNAVVAHQLIFSCLQYFQE